MGSNEEYLENLLKSMMNGEVANPAEKNLNEAGKKKSAIEMLTGEEPEQALILEESHPDLNEEVTVEEPFAEIPESDGAVSEGLTSDEMNLDSLLGDMDLNGLEGLEEPGQDGMMELAELGLDGMGPEDVLTDMEAGGSESADIGLEEADLGDGYGPECFGVGRYQF